MNILMQSCRYAVPEPTNQITHKLLQSDRTYNLNQNLLRKKTEKSEIQIQIVVDTLVSELLCSNLRETVIR